MAELYFPTLARLNKANYPDFDEADFELIRQVQPFTLTSPEKIVALVRAVEYIVRNKIEGAMAECGVWRGGSMLAVIQTLLRLGQTDRQLYLFDTFEGMTTPTAADVSFTGVPASTLLQREEAIKTEPYSIWTYAPLEDVQRTLLATNYPPTHLHFVKGRVEDTIPARNPGPISLLRLDTDWYESTYHELTHLFPRLTPGGVLIVDDYGHWQGQKKAVDQYFEHNNITMLLHRLDYAGRIGLKLHNL